MIKNRRGFTLIELLVSLVIIGILSTLGYRQYTKVTMDTKAQAVATELSMIKKAISETLADAGGYYQSTNTRPGPLKVGNAIQKIVDGAAEDDDSEFAKKIELSLHNQLSEMGLKFSEASGGFRLKSIPLAKLSFPMEINGVRAIRIEGVPGAIATKMISKLNDSPNLTKDDGTQTSRPLIITKSTSTIGKEKLDETDTSIAKGVTAIIGGADKKFLQVEEGEDEVTPEQLDAASLALKTSPKVTLYYVYQISDKW